MPTLSGTFGGDLADVGNYSAQLAALLPPGRLWDLERNSKLRALLQGMADEFERVRLRGHNLIDETDPRTAAETIGDWEKAFGLPDTRVTTIPGTLAERQVAVTQKVVGQGGQNLAYFTAFCLACGWPLLSLSVGTVLRVGFRCGALVYGSGWAYTMILSIDTALPNALPKADFERAVRHVTHSHIVDSFTYP